MTLLERDIEARPREGGLRSEHIHPGDPRFESWLDQRHQFMERMGWQLDSEYDRYDDDPETAHLVVNDDKGRLVVGMRLTPVRRYDQSLSWEMLAPAPEMQREIIESGELNSQVPIWDLTKLIQGETKFSPEVNHQAIAKLFGEALRETRPDGGDSTWVFAITAPLFRWLTMNGMHLHALSQGVVSPGDKSASIFGYVHTIQDVADSLESPIARRAVETLDHE